MNKILGVIAIVVLIYVLKYIDTDDKWYLDSRLM